jgi:DNA helicase HerA-like ATPase
LGNRIQHALRAFTPADQKTVRATAETFRINPKLDTVAALTELGVGEALISLLDAQGQPTVVERALIAPPRSQLGPITPAQRQQLMANSVVAGVYEKTVDRESAYERLVGTQAAGGGVPAPAATSTPASAPAPESKGFWSSLFGGSSSAPPGPASLPRSLPKGGGRRSDDLMTTMAKSTVRTIGSTVGRELVRGILGSFLGGGGRRR